MSNIRVKVSKEEIIKHLIPIKGNLPDFITLEGEIVEENKHCFLCRNYADYCPLCHCHTQYEKEFHYKCPETNAQITIVAPTKKIELLGKVTGEYISIGQYKHWFMDFDSVKEIRDKINEIVEYLNTYE